MSKKKGGMPKAHDMHPNVTPLIDIVMCLIIFYMLVAKIGVNTGADNTLKLPPSLMGIKIKDLGNTVTLNILPPLSGADLPRVTTLNPATGQVIDVPLLDQQGRRPLAEWVKRLRGQNEEFKVILRADKDLDYRYIEPVLLSAAEGRAKNVNFATAVESSVEIVGQ